MKRGEEGQYAWYNNELMVMEQGPPGLHVHVHDGSGRNNTPQYLLSEI